MNAKVHATLTEWADPDDASDMTDEIVGDNLVRAGRAERLTEDSVPGMRADTSPARVLESTGQ